jgi:lipoteichoic acid synthase
MSTIEDGREESSEWPSKLASWTLMPFRRLGVLAVGELSRNALAFTLRWASAVIAIVLTAKAAKLLMWEPVLQHAGGTMDRASAGLRTIILNSYLLRIILALALVSAVRWVWFRRRSNWWAMAFVLVFFLLIRAIAAIRQKHLDLFESYMFQQAVAEARLLYSFFREDLLVCVVVAWLAVLAALIASRITLRKTWPLTTALIVPSAVLAALFAIDLASFAKTGLVGSGNMLSFLMSTGAGTRSFIASEIDWQVAACVGMPFLIFAIVPPLFSRLVPQASGNRTAPGFGLSLLFVTIFVGVVHADLPTPRYARFAANPLAQWIGDEIGRSGSQLAANELANAAAEAPLLFDPRLKTAVAVRPTRNVVIVMLESVRAPATELYDARLTNTPFLKSLAEQSALVEDMYCVEPRTSAAWLSILYGIYPGDGDMFFLWSELERKQRVAVGLPKILKQYGYATAFFVPTHLETQNDYQIIENLGFDKVMQYQPRSGAHVDALDPAGFEKVNFFGVEDRALLGPIEDWVKRQTSARTPMLVTIMTNVAHYPYNPPKKWPREHYLDRPDGPYNDYLNSIAYIDSYLRDVYAIFERSNLLDSTMFVVLGDHGESFGEHGPRQHFGQAYEDVLHIPAIVRAPWAVSGPLRISGLRQQIDVLPTVLDLLGISVTSGRMAGTSLLSPAASDRKLFFSGVYESSTLGMRSRATKFLYNFRRIPMEVYDLTTDPSEMHDLAASTDEEMSASAERDMLLWRARVNRALLANHSVGN